LLGSVVSDVSGPDRRCAGATDDEVFGVASRWAALESWAFAGKLGVARELIRRHPAPAGPGGGAGPATGDLPAEWDPQLEHELSLELRISPSAAKRLLYLAWALEARLPGIGRVLHEGRLDPGPARMIVEETDVLTSPAQLADAEAMILAGIDDCMTWTAFRRLVQRAVCTVDPEGARKRREKAERETARVAFWRETSGAATLAGYSLPTDEALSANASVEARARWYRAAGVKERIDLLRVLAFLDLLNVVPAEDRVARWRAGQATTATQADAPEAQSAPPRHPGSSGTAHPRPGTQDEAPPPTGRGAPDGDDPSGAGLQAPEDDVLRDDHEARDDCLPAGPGLPARVNLTLPLATQLGLAQRPGEAWELGVLDPELVRRLAQAAARSPDSRFCVTITDEHGHAIGHGCCKPARSARNRASGQDESNSAPRRDRPQTAARRKLPNGNPGPGPAPPGTPVPGSAVPGSAVPGLPGVAIFTPSGRPGPVGGYGSWTLTLPGAPAAFTVDLHPVPVGQCDHRYESPGHDPTDRLRHLVQVRDGKCSFPTCSRHARESDFEHATPHDHGGRTCGCNCHSCSRTCHQLKQQPGWSVTQPRPGWRQWTTPAGRTYTQAPWKYPA
jgi:hypothetical protein